MTQSNQTKYYISPLHSDESDFDDSDCDPHFIPGSTSKAPSLLRSGATKSSCSSSSSSSSSSGSDQEAENALNPVASTSRSTIQTATESNVPSEVQDTEKEKKEQWGNNFSVNADRNQVKWHDIKINSVIMKLYIFLSCIVVIHGAAISDEKCDGITIDGVYYDKEVLKTDLDRPYSLVVDFGTNVLYFSYNLYHTDDIFKTAKINLDTKDFAKLDGVENGFGQTVDQTNHVLYIGTSKGIYKYNNTDNTAKLYAAHDTDIGDVYFKDELYYSEFPSLFVYTVKDGQTERFKDLEETQVTHFAIDDEEDMFYVNSTGLYSQKKNTKDSVLYKEMNYGEGFRGITTDVNGKVYICFSDGIYKVNKHTTTVEKMVDVDDAFGAAFDGNNNIVYANSTSLIYLKASENKNC
ncbi:unnamed protein product [Parnassius apollo]|uniref:(apollo) hypothetical protein n=1 Tax=Parnassius apollo TaxID=110799 RepID=A0A8S3WHX2_PARAO|nr:unnamed protein product [Parnassius apollo]